MILNIIGKLDSINRGVGYGVASLMFVMALVVFYDVIARTVFNAPTNWSYVLALFIFTYVAFLGGGWALLENAHVRVDIFHSRLSPRWQSIVDVITAPFIFIFVGTLLWQGANMFWQSFSILEIEGLSMWHAPIYPIKLAIPIGAALLFLQALAIFVKNILISVRGSS